jgi:hypothetical protein
VNELTDCAGCRDDGWQGVQIGNSGLHFFALRTSDLYIAHPHLTPWPPSSHVTA